MSDDERKLVDEMLAACQTIKIAHALICGDLMNRDKWMRETDKADRAWRRINEAHESLVTGIKIPRPQ